MASECSRFSRVIEQSLELMLCCAGVRLVVHLNLPKTLVGLLPSHLQPRLCPTCILLLSGLAAIVGRETN